ncbi:DUF459 domain-containing protein [Helicobacter sp. faydin-H20]|uniref:SGNH/GDSL hydrolase family protein n=1 Tax=Helicobacter anatolicus TaxID=2905874 RepID=UPI001E30E866|nr:DUF459 domain-containing protein [Helicobacter anatolicus]MCE3036559.1 DUF459 domain-containing protein [Helicobacter anatolicus]
MRFLGFFLTLVVVFVFNIITFHKSLNNYIEQKYHINILATFFPSNSSDEISLTQETQSIQEIPPAPKYPHIKDGKIILKPQTSFLLIGDSMMQGIATSLAPQLKKLNMQVSNIAKQSTGLTYTNFFNWPEKLEEELQEKEFDIIVVMVGANDPWTIKRNIYFKTEEWNAIYTDRIQSILQIAKYHQALVIWYEVPLVKNKKLSARLPHLNSLYQQNVESSNNLFLQTNQIFAPDGNYIAFLQEENKSISLRANDGIHFTRSGAKILANLLLERLEILPDEEEDNLELDSPPLNNDKDDLQPPQQ